MSLPSSAQRCVDSLWGSHSAHRLWRGRVVWSPFMRVVSVVAAVIIAGATLGLDAASAGATVATTPLHESESQGIPHGEISVRAKSSYEEAFNPYGDDWDRKGAPNTSVAVGLTPACYKRNPKLLPVEPPLPPLNPEEAAFIAKSNTPMVWEECADVMDASGPDGFGRIGDIWIKRNIDQQKAVNPNLKYVGYLPMTRADTQTIGQGAATVGLKFIHANREAWFVHRKDNGAVRVKYNQSPGGSPSDLFDVTNAEFRTFMTQRIVESMNFHGMDGFVLDQCFDIPMSEGGTSLVPDAILNNWGQGCINMLAELKAALNPLGKKVFFTGFFHYSSGGNDTIEEAFYRARIDASNGIYWEDPLKAVSASDSFARSTTDRMIRLQEYALGRGAHFVNTVNTAFENQSSFPSSYDQQQYLARYFTAGFLVSADTRQSDGGWGPLRVMYHYMPIASGPQFYSAAFFREWDAPIGVPLAAHQTPLGGSIPVYLREFANARVVFNASSSSYQLDLSSGGPWKTVAGDPLPNTFTVPAKSGFIALREPAVCTPRSPVTVTVSKIGDGQFQAIITAGAASGNLTRIQVLGVQNAVVDIEGGPSNITSATTYNLSPIVKSRRIIFRRTGSGPMTVPLNITDACGDWKTFVGAGGGA